MCHSDPRKLNNIVLLNIYIINTIINEKEENKVNRRDFLFIASYTIGAVGLGAVIWPLVHQMNPDKAQQALAKTEVDISQVEDRKSVV